MSKQSIRLTFLGDLMCLPCQIAAQTSMGCGYEVVFDGVKHLWKESDYVIANLETPIAPHAGKAAHGPMTFNAPLEFLQAVRHAGVNFVSLANNHVWDCGEAGLDETLKHLGSEGLETTGVYADSGRREKAFVRTIDGVRIGIVCCTYGINGLDAAGLPQEKEWRVDTLTRGSILHQPERHQWLRSMASSIVPAQLKALRRNIKAACSGVPVISPIPDSIDGRQIDRAEDRQLVERMCSKIKDLSGQVDFVVVYPHIGGQYNLAPGRYQRWVEDLFIKAGADLVICNHAHRPLPCELRSDGRVVAHALGNFCFTPGVGYYLPNVLADYSVVLHIDLTRGERAPKVSFDVCKSVVDQNGFAKTCSVYDLYHRLPDGVGKAMLVMENEAVVHCLRGGVEQIEVDREYVLRQNKKIEE